MVPPTPLSPAQLLAARVAEYLGRVDQALEIQSHGQEGLTSRLPRWLLAPRRIRVGVAVRHKAAFVEVDADDASENDQISAFDIQSIEDLAKVAPSWRFTGPLSEFGRRPFTLFSEITLTPKDRPLDPAIHAADLFGMGNIAGAWRMFDPATAAEEAVNQWVAVRAGASGTTSVVEWLGGCLPGSRH